MGRLYNKGYFFLVFMFIILSPLLSLPFILYGIYHRYKVSFFFMSVFLGLVAFLIGPTGDLYRHTLDYYSYIFYDPKNWIVFFSGGDFITQIIAFMMAQNGIPYPFLRFFTVIISYNILFGIFNDYIDTTTLRYTKTDLFCRFMLLIFISDFFEIIYGVRFVFSVSILLLGFYSYYINNKKILGVVITITSICIHYAILYYAIVLLLIPIIIKIEKNKIWIVAFLAFLIGFLGYNLLIIIASYMNLKFMGYMSEGTWGTGTLEHEGARAGITRIFRYVYDRISIPLATMLVLYEFYDKRNFNCRILYGIVLLFCITNQFGTAGGRVLYISEYFLFIFLIAMEQEKQQLIRKRVFKIVFLLFLFRTFMHVVGYGNIIRISSEHSKLILPVTEIFQTDYNLTWIFKNVNPDGSIKR